MNLNLAFMTSLAKNAKLVVANNTGFKVPNLF